MPVKTVPSWTRYQPSASTLHEWFGPDGIPPRHRRVRCAYDTRGVGISATTLVVRIFPNAAACLRLVRALAAEIHEDWIEATRYLNMELLEEHKREQLRR